MALLIIVFLNLYFSTITLLLLDTNSVDNSNPEILREGHGYDNPFYILHEQKNITNAIVIGNNETGLTDQQINSIAIGANAGKRYQGWGYDNVSPPLVEYEETILSGMGKKSSDSVFKFSDPENRRTLVLRSDITTQIGRISSTRLKYFSWDDFPINKLNAKPFLLLLFKLIIDF